MSIPEIATLDQMDARCFDVFEQLDESIKAEIHGCLESGSPLLIRMASDKAIATIMIMACAGFGRAMLNKMQEKQP